MANRVVKKFHSFPHLDFSFLKKKIGIIHYYYSGNGRPASSYTGFQDVVTLFRIMFASCKIASLLHNFMGSFLRLNGHPNCVR